MVGHEIWGDTLKKVQNGKQTLQDMEYVKKQLKTLNMRNKICRTRIVARNTEKREERKLHILGHGICQEI